MDALTLSSGNPALDIINAQTWLSSLPVLPSVGAEKRSLTGRSGPGG